MKKKTHTHRSKNKNKKSKKESKSTKFRTKPTSVSALVGFFLEHWLHKLTAQKINICNHTLVHQHFKTNCIPVVDNVANSCASHSLYASTLMPRNSKKKNF